MTIQILAADPVYTVEAGVSISATDGTPLFELAQSTSNEDDVLLTQNNYGSLSDSGTYKVIAIDDYNVSNFLAVFNNFGTLTVESVGEVIGAIASVQNDGEISVTVTGPATNVGGQPGIAYGVAPPAYFINDGTLDVTAVDDAYGVVGQGSYTEVTNSSDAAIDVVSTSVISPLTIGITMGIGAVYGGGFVNNAGNIIVSGGSMIYGIYIGLGINNGVGPDG